MKFINRIRTNLRVEAVFLWERDPNSVLKQMSLQQTQDIRSCNTGIHHAYSERENNTNLDAHIAKERQ